MDNERRRKGSNVTRKRGEVELDYESANALLNAFMRKVYQFAYNRIIPGNFKNAGLTVDQKNTIHNEMFKLINVLKFSLSLDILLGSASPINDTQKRLIAMFFGSDDNEIRSTYFKEQLGNALYSRLASMAKTLKVEFGKFGNNLVAVFLRDNAGDDFVEYHMTVGRGRIHEGKLSSYHFSNHFNPGEDGTLRSRQTYYRNDGTPYARTQNSERNAIRELRRREEVTEEELALYHRALAFKQFQNAPTVNLREEIGPARLATEEAAAGGGGGGGAGGRKSAMEEAAEREAEENRLLEEAIRQVRAEKEAIAAAEGSAAAVPQNIVLQEARDRVALSRPSKEMESILQNTSIMGMTVGSHRIILDSMIDSFFKDISTLESSVLLPVDKKLIEFILTSDVFPDIEQAKDIVRAIVYDRYKLEKTAQEYAATSEENKLKAFQKASNTIKAIQKSKSSEMTNAAITAASQYRNLQYPRIEEILLDIFTIRFNTPLGQPHKYPRGLWISLVEEMLKVPENNNLHSIFNTYLSTKPSMLAEYLKAANSLERTTKRLKKTGTEEYKRLVKLIKKYPMKGGRRKTRRRKRSM